MKKKTTIALPLVLLVGLSLLLYPTVSNYWNSLHQSRAIAGYVESVSAISDEKHDAMLADAHAYNQRINRLTVSTLTDGERQDYYRQLNVTDSGIMGYIEIPSIDCSLPVYHGTADSILQVATGHVEGSSLPVGGKGTHCVISGHRGLPSAKLFTNLDQLQEGDVFLLSVLGEELTYEVDRISVVEPEDISELTFEADQDLCTLVTCTPYGVNSHRLLVRGHRVPNGSVTILRVATDATQIHSAWVVAAVCAPSALSWLLWRRLRRRREHRA